MIKNRRSKVASEQPPVDQVNGSHYESEDEKIVSQETVVASADFNAMDAIDDFVLKHEKLVPFVIAILAIITRFYRLALPNGVVFDESHFIRFTNQYTARTYFFDIHPPLGKLTLWAMGQIVGLNQPDPTVRPFMSLNSDCNYQNISEDFHDGCKYVYLRAVAATFSSASVVLMYFIIRNWGGSTWAGILASGILLFDMLNNIQGRLVLLDVQLSFWCLAALLGAQLWWKRFNQHSQALDLSADAGIHHVEEEVVAPSAESESKGDNEDSERSLLSTASSDECVTPVPAPADSNTIIYRYQPLPALGAMDSTFYEKDPLPMSDLERNLWCLVMGILVANAPSVKMTGGVTPLLIAVESFTGIFFLRRPVPFKDLLKVLVVAFLVYAFYFLLHFMILTRAGDAEKEFMTVNFQKTLIGNELYDPEARWEGFWWTFFTLNIRMVVHNAAILAPHPWMSNWKEWIFNERGVAYYGKDAGDSTHASMYLIGNHAIHMLVLVAFAAFFLAFVIYFRFRVKAEALANASGDFGSRSLNPIRMFMSQGLFCILGFVLNLVPYLGVARSTFIYHYMPALLYGELLLTLTASHLAGKYTPTVAKIILLVVGLVWLHYTPWIYAFGLTSDGHERRRWNPRWN